MLVETSRIRFYPEYAKTTFLVYALIGSIAVFFLATFIAYAVRYVFAGPPVGTVPQLPRLLWWSTAILFLGSHFLFRAYALVRREKQKQFRIALTISFLLGGLFCIVQSIGIRQLTIEHWELAGNQAGLIASVILMAFLHVAHFVAGYIALGYVLIQACRGRYDHEYTSGVRLAAIYWRFLDLVWLCMLLLFWLAAHR